jgi:hypothetical protein
MNESKLKSDYDHRFQVGQLFNVDSERSFTIVKIEDGHIITNTGIHLKIEQGYDNQYIYLDDGTYISSRWESWNDDYIHEEF